MRPQLQHFSTSALPGMPALILSATQNSQNSPMKRASSLDLLQVGQYFIMSLSFLEVPS
jgi:hypothetical protein